MYGDARRAYESGSRAAPSGRELEEERVEADRVAQPLEHGRFQIVVEDHPRNAAPASERGLVSAEEILALLTEIEPQEERAREREHGDERDERALASSDLEPVLLAKTAA